MSRRSRTTLTIQVKLPLPPGAKQEAVAPWILAAIKQAAKEYPEPLYFGELQVNEILVKIVAKDTQYY